MPACIGERVRSSFQTSSAEAYFQSWPSRRAMSQMISMSSRASPGGSSALRTRCTRRSLFVTVPSASHQLAEAGRTTSAICGGPGEEDVLDDQVLEALEQLVRVLGVGLGLGRVLADDVERRQLAALHRLEHLGQVPAVLRHDLDAPRLAEPLPGLGVALEVLEAGQLVRDGAHVAAALDVVLPAQRVQAGAVAADVAGQQREVDQREDVVDRVVVLGDPERPAQDRAVGARVRERQLADHVGGDAGLALAALERPLLDRRRELLEAGRGPVDELAVVQAGVDDLARDRVGEGDVGADVEAEPAVGPLGRDGAPRVDRRTAARRCARPSGRGGRRSGASPGRSIPTG